MAQTGSGNAMAPPITLDVNGTISTIGPVVTSDTQLKQQAQIDALKAHNAKLKAANVSLKISFNNKALSRLVSVFYKIK